MNRYLTLLALTFGCVPGEDGADGADGADGEDGLAGINCWDVDGDRVDDPEEDVNGDGVWDAYDCLAMLEESDTGEGSSVPVAWWVDADGTRVGPVLADDVRHIDADGYLWRVDPDDGSVFPGYASEFFAQPGCSGDSYVTEAWADSAGMYPRHVFLLHTGYAVVPDTGVSVVQVTLTSQWNNDCNDFTSPLTVSALPVSEMVPSPLPVQPDDFTPPLHIELL